MLIRCKIRCDARCAAAAEEAPAVATILESQPQVQGIKIPRSRDVSKFSSGFALHEREPTTQRPNLIEMWCQTVKSWKIF